MALDSSLSLFVLLSDRGKVLSVRQLVALGRQGCRRTVLPACLLRCEEQHICATSIMHAASRGETPLTAGQGRALMSTVKAPSSLHFQARERRFHYSSKRADSMFKAKLMLNKFLKFI